MDSLLSIPSSHRRAETQIDVGVLGIQASSHIFVASALPTTNPTKCGVCAIEKAQTRKTQREQKGVGTQGCAQRTLDRGAKSISEAM